MCVCHARSDASCRLPVWNEDAALQVSHVNMNGNTAELQVSEMTINDIHLRFVDRTSGETRDEGKTKPEVILRQVLSQPGQVSTRLAFRAPWVFNLPPGWQR